MKVLVTGANGQLGRCLQDTAVTYGVEVLSYGSQELDITDRQQVSDIVSAAMPDAIVNAAAYTAVDKAESDEARTYAVNADGPENLAQVCNSLNIPLVHISTDYVFDGCASIPYKPDAPTSPSGVYGRSKLEGEKRIQSSACRYLIIRTAWVFSEYGNNFVRTMLRLGKEREELGIVADQVGGPTYAGDLAEAIWESLPQLVAEGYSSCVEHFAGTPACSWYDFADAIFSCALEQGILKTKPALNKLSTNQYPTPAKRPSFSVLDCTTFFERFGIQEAEWNKVLSSVVRKIAE